MVINEAGLALIKSFEDCSLTPYLDVGGVPTIGWGHTSGVTMDMAPCTQQEADDWLDDDLIESESEIENDIYAHMNENQFSALVSLVFNCGVAPLQGHLGQYMRAGDHAAAAEEFLKWNHVNHQVVNGLTRRREAEKALFLTPVTE